MWYGDQQCVGILMEEQGVFGCSNTLWEYDTSCPQVCTIW
jgi:hypothetical protein